MKDSGQRPAVLMAVFGASGFTIVAATFAGFAIGLWLDRRLGTSPLFLIALLMAGFLAALVNVYYRARQDRKDK